MPAPFLQTMCWSLVCVMLAAVSADACASDWPRFRGPNGSGVSADKNVPVEFSGQSPTWKTKLPGSGNSSPVVAHGKIFLQTASADGQQRSLVCIKLEDGQILWTKNVPGHIGHTHKKSSLASGTAVIDGERVYVPFWDGTDLSVSAFDLEGKVLWTRDLGPFKSQHGAGHSPIVHGGKVFLANDQDGASSLVALDGASGKIDWQVTRPATRTCYSTPILHERGDGSVELIVASTAGLAGYDPQSGTENWKWNWTGNRLRTVGSPVVNQGIVFVSSGDGAGNRHAIAVKVGGDGDLSASNLLWEEKKSFPYVPCMLTAGEHLFLVNDRGIAACHIGKTGENVWTQRLGGNMSASPILVDGKIYAASEDGQVFVFAAQGEYKLLATNTIDELIMATPAVADSRLIIRGADHLYCFGPTAAK